MNENFKFDIPNKLNLKTNDFFCCMSNGDGYFLHNIIDSISGAVINERNAEDKLLFQRSSKFDNVRFINDINELDESAFDKVVCFFDGDLFSDQPLKIMNNLINCTDHLGLVLVKNLPTQKNNKYNSCYSENFFTNWLNSKGVFDVWLFRNGQYSFDLLFKVRKW